MYLGMGGGWHFTPVVMRYSICSVRVLTVDSQAKNFMCSSHFLRRDGISVQSTGQPYGPFTPDESERENEKDQRKSEQDQ